MRELLTFVAQSLVDHPDQVVVRETEGPEAVPGHSSELKPSKSYRTSMQSRKACRRIAQCKHWIALV